MTFEELAKKVADDFRVTMKDEGFDTLKEMCDCYWWSPADLKEDIGAVIWLVSGGEAYLDEIDGSDVCLNGDCISYRKFAYMFRKYLKEMGDTNNDEDEEE